MGNTSDLRTRLHRARLYFICGTRPAGLPLQDVLGPALAGGVDVFQLRDKDASPVELRAAADAARAATRTAGALFIVNDDPLLAVAVEADGVHVGQHDIAVAGARAIVGDDRLVGMSTHSESQVTEACRAGADYIGVGPVYETPTKPGRAAVGVELITHATHATTVPFFAIGGICADNVSDVMAHGATRVAVVRAIAESDDPAAAAHALRDALTTQVETAGGPA